MQSLKKNSVAFTVIDEDLSPCTTLPEFDSSRQSQQRYDEGITFRAPLAHDNQTHGNLSMAALLLQDEIRNASWMYGEEASAHCINAARNVLQAALEQERKLAEQAMRISELEKAVNTDILTGLLNRRGFESEFSRILSSARRFDEEGVLIYIDLDDFKPVNDTYGHAAGDAILRRLGAILRSNIRQTDCVGRIGGDEFAVVLTRTKHESAIGHAKRLGALLNTSHIEWQQRTIPLKASLGYQPYGPKDTAEQLLHGADAAMYRTKKARVRAACGDINRQAGKKPGTKVEALVDEVDHRPIA